MTIQFTKPEIEALMKQRLQSGEFKDAEDVILQAPRSSQIAPREKEAERAAAIQRLKTFGKAPPFSRRQDDQRPAP